MHTILYSLFLLVSFFVQENEQAASTFLMQVNSATIEETED